MSDPSIDDGSNPEEAERRDSMITLRVTASERSEIEAASESAGRFFGRLKVRERGDQLLQRRRRSRWRTV